MARRSFSRREMGQSSSNPVALVLAAAVALFLGMYLPKLFPNFALLDLPLIIVIYFSVSQRSPILATLTGAGVGLLQDLATNSPIGILGIAKTIVGYAAASVSLRVDVENIVSRIVLNFGFSLLQSCLIYAVTHWMLGMPTYQTLWLRELLRAGVNTAVALPISLLLDRVRMSGARR